MGIFFKQASNTCVFHVATYALHIQIISPFYFTVITLWYYTITQIYWFVFEWVFPFPFLMSKLCFVHKPLEPWWVYCGKGNWTRQESGLQDQWGSRHCRSKWGGAGLEAGMRGEIRGGGCSVYWGQLDGMLRWHHSASKQREPVFE